MVNLVVVDRSTGARREYSFHKSPVLVGRADSCHLILRRNGVLDLHGEISFEGGQVFYSDLDPEAETLLDYEPIPRGARVPLPIGAPLRIGSRIELLRARQSSKEHQSEEDPFLADASPSLRAPVPAVQHGPSPGAAGLIFDKTELNVIASTEVLDPVAKADPARVTPATSIERLPLPSPRIQRESEELKPGAVLGQYRLERLLGKGGMGTVFEASHTGVIEKRFALKVLAPDLVALEDAERRFLAEAAVASRLDHAHIVNVHDFGNEHGISYLVMEYLRGESLATRINRKELSIARIADIMIAVASGVTAAHEKGICHRDLKPENIFLATVGKGDTVPKVLDFGIARVLESDGESTLRGALIGTPNYLAPEQAKHRFPADMKSDQYALGAVLYECTTRRRAHEGPTLNAVLRSIAEADYRPVSDLRPDVPREFEAIITKAMSKRPQDRFMSVRDLGRALIPFISRKRYDYWVFHYSDDAAGESTLGGVLLTRSDGQSMASSRPPGGVGGTKILPSTKPLSVNRSSPPGTFAGKKENTWILPAVVVGIAVLAALVLVFALNGFRP